MAGLRVMVALGMLLAGCAPETGAEVEDDAALLPDGLVAPAYSLTLTGPATARPGQRITFTVTGASPNRTVTLYGTTRGTLAGAGPCPSLLGGLCLDLVAPTLTLGSAKANGQGRARITVTVPATYDNLFGSVQAAHGPAAVASTSRVITVAIADDDDGDGLTELAGDCDDTRASVRPGAAEVVANGIDEDCDGADACYADADGDGFGGAAPVPGNDLDCADVGEAASATDCDDADVSVYPGAPEVPVDGVDQDCDGGDVCYADGDGDGYAAGGTVPSADLDCADAGEAARLGDCDDSLASANPGATEACDGVDNDCDGTVDTDTWWDAAWPYRIPVTVTTSPDWFSQGAPIALDVDFDAALRALGDTSGLASGSVRVVHQDCAWGLPEMPSEFADDLSGLFEPVDVVDPAGDDFGAVVWLFDRDGDYTSLDVVRPGLPLRFAIYFGSNDTTGSVAPPSYPTSQTAVADGTSGTLTNAETDAAFSASQGGVATRLGPIGGPNVGAQGTTVFGNGVFMGPATGGGGSWVSAAAGTGASVQLVHDGPMIGVLRATGAASNAFGGFTYSYTYFQIDSRPEVYAKVRYVLDRPSGLGPQGAFWGAAIRPYNIDNVALLGSSPQVNEASGGVPDFEWARGTYDVNGNAHGVALGWRRSVALRSRPQFDTTTNVGRYLGLAGQDLQPVFSQTSTYAGQAGDVLVNHAVVAVYAHLGRFGAVSNDFYATLDGPTAAPGAVEAR